MKKLKSFLLFILCTGLTIAMVLSSLSYCFHRTILSSRHVGEVLESDRNLSSMTELLYTSITETADSQQSHSLASIITIKTLRRTEPEWLKSQVYIGVKGIHNYLTTENTILPTLDFTHLNNAIREQLMVELLEQPQGKAKIQNVRTVLTALDNKYFSTIINFGLNNKLVSMLLELSPVQDTGFDKTTLQEVVRIYISFSNKNLDLDEASHQIVKQMTEEFLELSKLKDYFDLNVFMEKAFGNNDPLKALKRIIQSSTKVLSRTATVLFWCFVIYLTLVQKLRLLEAVKSLAYCGIFASITTLLLALLLMNASIVQSLLNVLLQPKGIFDSFSFKLYAMLLRDAGSYLLLQSIVTSLIAMAFAILLRRTGKKPQTKKKHFNFPIIRACLIVTVFIVVFCWWNFSELQREAKLFQANRTALQSADLDDNIIKGLIEAGGMHFLKHLQKTN